LAATLESRQSLPLGLALLIAVQVVCAVFFLGDIAADYREMGFGVATELHLLMELVATASLCAAIVVEVRYIFRLLRRKAHLERSVSIASAAMQDIIDAHFDEWGLTRAEADVATFLVKGMSIAEIAGLRDSAEGTVKSHLNSIYRKSGTRGRGELLSVILDGLLDGGRA
jgi:DNA-binding CsgD family transcriptional regulator